MAVPPQSSPGSPGKTGMHIRFAKHEAQLYVGTLGLSAGDAGHPTSTDGEELESLLRSPPLPRNRGPT